MKRRTEIVLLAITGILMLVAIGIGILFFRLRTADKQSSGERVSRIQETVQTMDQFSKPGYQKFVSLPGSARLPDMKVNKQNLAERIRACGCRMVLEVLPADSRIVSLTDTTLKIVNVHQAELAGQAVVTADERNPEQILNFQVRVHFLDSGDCEAAFPEFSAVNPERK